MDRVDQIAEEMKKQGVDVKTMIVRTQLGYWQLVHTLHRRSAHPEVIEKMERALGIKAVVA